MNTKRQPIIPIDALAKNHGSITLEAALVLPLFLAFMLALISFIRLCLIYAAVSEAVHETAAQVATHLYPAQLLVAEAAATKAGQSTLDFIERVKSAREEVEQAEDAAANYAAWLPEDIAQLLAKEKQLRLQAENQAKMAALRAVEPALQRFIWEYVDPGAKDRWIKQKNFTLTDLVIPDLTDGNPARFALEVEYAWHVPIPFVDKTLRFRVRAEERSWLGGV